MFNIEVMKHDEIRVIDNFLDKKIFKNLQDILLNKSEFPWFLNYNKVIKIETNIIMNNPKKILVYIKLILLSSFKPITDIQVSQVKFRVSRQKQT